MLEFESCLIYFIDLIAIYSFAISGAITAMNTKLDIVGVFIVAFITALGGGTARDLLIGNSPVNWVSRIDYLYTILIATITSILAKKILEHKYSKNIRIISDSIGLGIFTIYGVEAALEHGINQTIAVAMGAVTSIFGGVSRDIICNQIPLVFKSEIYASVSIFGGILFIILNNYNVDKSFILLIVPTIVVVLRIIIIKYKLSLPSIYK